MLISSAAIKVRLQLYFSQELREEMETKSSGTWYREGKLPTKRRIILHLYSVHYKRKTYDTNGTIVEKIHIYGLRDKTTIRPSQKH